MTIMQLKYVIAIANSSSMREAASKLYVSQPALSATIRELEEELGIRIFDRNNKGISITAEGEEFLSYAKQAVSQYRIIEDRYIDSDPDKVRFSVSMQHYVFAIHAFIDVVKRFDFSKYVFSVVETKTNEVLNNVRDLKSEVGVIAYSTSNEKVMKKIFREFQLNFTPLLVKDTFAYVWKDHPLAKRKTVSLEDLKEYPCVSFDQDSNSEFYLAEEALGEYDFSKLIKSSDRATTSEIMAGLNGYSIGTGIMTDSIVLRDGFVTIKLKEQDPLTIGYITRQGHNLSEVGEEYIAELEKYRGK